MKQKITFLTAFWLMSFNLSDAQNIFPASGATGIGTTTPHSSSLLDITSTNKGLLIPRMTQAQRQTIGSPATGLLIFQTDQNSGFYYYSGSTWVSLNVRGLNNNIFIGQSCGESNTTAKGNIALGKAALKKNTSRSNLVAIGDSSLFNNGSGVSSSFQANYNTAVGAKTLKNNTVGAWNTAFGHQALYSNTTGDYNTAFGSEALQKVSFGVGNTAVGYHTLQNSNGFYNVGVGKDALNSNTTGSDNVAIGKEALFNNSTRSGNVAIGTYALFSNEIGVSFSYEATDNVAVGFEVLKENTTGFDNTGLGYFALHSNDVGFHNTAIGSYSINQNTSGFYNTAIGDNTMTQNTTGSQNTALGHFTLVGNVSGTYNTCVGAYSNMSDGLTNSTAIGNNAFLTTSNSIAVGNTSVGSIKGQVGFTTFSDGRIKKNVSENVPGLAFIRELRPVTYNYDIHLQNDMLGVKDNGEWEGKYDIEKILFTGFIAQEVETAAKKTGYDFSGIDKSSNLLGLRYAEFTVPLVKAVQEIDGKYTALENENITLKNKVQALENSITEMKNCIETLCADARNKSANDLIIRTKNTLLLNPNPSAGILQVEYTLEKSSFISLIKVTDSTGKLLKTIALSNLSGRIEINMENYANGKYLLQLVSNNELIKSESFILNK